MTTDNYKQYFLKNSDKKQKNQTMYSPYKKTDPGIDVSPRNSFELKNELVKTSESANDIRFASNKLFGKDFKDLTNIQKVMLYKHVSS